jgi:gamma-glutamyl-gamma-aminobutyrate hydrolase PuuD
MAAGRTMKRVLTIAGSPEHWGPGDTLPYEEAFRGAGAELVVIAASSAFASIGALLESAGGVLLMGGCDVDPRLYGDEPGPDTQPPDTARDTLEFEVIREALDRDLPLFGICRGLQILNVQQGGTLVQHLPGAVRHVRRTADKGLPAHTVRIEPETLFAKLAGDQLIQSVNSRHHQGIARLGKGLRVAARDPEDGTVEAIERPDLRFCLAVQWHPENQRSAESGNADLIRAFISAV